MSVQLLKQNLDALMLDPELDNYRFAPENLNREITETVCQSNSWYSMPGSSRKGKVIAMAG